MKKPFQREAYNYWFWGSLFGLCFPIVASGIESFQQFGALTFPNLWAVQAQSPLLWIIDTAPLFLGLFAYFTGKQVDTVKEKNQEILQAQELLILQEQMASVGQMMAGIAHEIKNPLNFVTNFAEGSIEIGEELREAFRQHREKFSAGDFDYLEEMIADLEQNAQEIKSSGERANRIIMTLMDHTRGAKGERVAVDVNRLVDENVNLAFHSYRASNPSFNLLIQKDLDTLPARVMGNPQSLGRALLNILDNACFALHQKQRELGTDFTPTLLIQTKVMPSEVIIRIRDNGPGIPEAIRHRIFTPFFTTKPVGAGNTGLGLAISREIICHEHQGALDVVSEPGESTEFNITLPAGGTEAAV